MLHSVPPPLQQATPVPRDAGASTGKSRTVSCGVTAHFSWVLVHKVLLCPPRVCFPVLCKFRQLYGGFMMTPSKRACARPRSAAPRAPAPAGVHCRPGPPQETLRHSSVSVSVGPWVLVPLFGRFEHLWREWGLILNANSPLLPSCWGFSFALGHGVSPHSHSRISLFI